MTSVYAKPKKTADAWAHFVELAGPNMYSIALPVFELEKFNRLWPIQELYIWVVDSNIRYVFKDAIKVRRTSMKLGACIIDIKVRGLETFPTVITPDRLSMWGDLT